jgi:nucleoside-diphosphate-sugar epimerase
LLVWEVYRQLVSEANVLEIQGTGSEVRDFLHAEDACAALLTLAQRAKRGARIVNVASGIETSVSQLVEEMKRISKIGKMLMCHGVPRQGDPRQWEADITRLRELAPGWSARSLHIGLTETMAQWQSGG